MQKFHKQVVSPDIQSALPDTNAWVGTAPDDLDRNKRDAANRTDIPVFFFPVLYNTITGIRSVDSEVINAARTLGASDWNVLTTILLPLAVPNIFTGLRLEAGMAWRVVIAAEMVAIPTGIGALLISSESLLRVDVIIVCLMVLSVMCLAFERVFQYIETRLTKEWR